MTSNTCIVGPIESNGAIPINVQDQHTEIVILPFHVILNQGIDLLASDTVVGNNTISLTPGHGASAGNLLYIKNGTHFYSTAILSIPADEATVDTPLDHVFGTSADVIIGNANLTVSGSLGSPTVAKVCPPPDVEWDITRIHVEITDNSAMDSGKFGGRDGLTNGIVLRAVDGTIKNIANVKTNGDLALMSSDYAYDDKAPAGVYGFLSKHIFAGQEHVGVTIRLVGATEDTLEALIQDGLEELVTLKIVAIGHIVTD